MSGTLAKDLMQLRYSSLEMLTRQADAAAHRYIGPLTW
jgi:hypothetical protein